MLWYKDGNPLTDKKVILTDFGDMLVSNKATFEQSGTYQCVAMNQVGEAKFEYLVDVLGKLFPVLQELQRKIRNKEGKTIIRHTVNNNILTENQKPYTITLKLWNYP